MKKHQSGWINECVHTSDSDLRASPAAGGGTPARLCCLPAATEPPNQLHNKPHSTEAQARNPDRTHPPVRFECLSGVLVLSAVCVLLPAVF